MHNNNTTVEHSIPDLPQRTLKIYDFKAKIETIHNYPLHNFLLTLKIYTYILIVLRNSYLIWFKNIPGSRNH